VQVIRAADSIASNISEGYGRYFFKDTKLFLYYARGSAHEMKTWIIKANKRDLINPQEFESMITKTDFLIALINGFIKSTGNTP